MTLKKSKIRMHFFAINVENSLMMLGSLDQKYKILEINDHLAAQPQNQHATQLQKKHPSVQEASPSPVRKQIRQNEMIDSLETSSTKHSPIVKVSHFASM